ncbi:MAG: hypothetical protein GQ569_14255 [Methylococcaceae bacterium]|nr:hypothetical protein [Methylococcaceae bacterium]
MIKVLTLLAILFLVGCAGTPELTEKVKPIVVKKDLKKPLKWSIASLNKSFEEWESVKYKWGGLSKKGVDCSGFVYLTFLEQFGVKLPRNTALQVKLGETIPKDKLKTGDLVFFKTGRRVRHVGIYLNNNKFIHASSSRGVTTSSLKSKYWSRKYWKAQRLSPEKFKHVS